MSVLTASGGTSSQEVAEIINRQAKTTWPAVCGDPTLFNVSLDSMALKIRFERLYKKRNSCQVERMRKKALAILSRTQIHAVPDGMPLWNYFQSSSNTLIPKGRLAALEGLRVEAKGLRAEVKAGRPPPIEVPTQQARGLTRTNTVIIYHCTRTVRPTHVRSLIRAHTTLSMPTGCTLHLLLPILTLLACAFCCRRRRRRRP
jgi:hypothetical protein